MSISRPLLGVIAAVTLALSATACTPPHQNDSTEPTGPAVSGEVLMTSQAPASSSTPHSTTSATEAATEDVEVTVTPTTLIEGEDVTFEITGLDPNFGYYAAICAADAAPANRIPMCTGQQMNPTSQAWLSNTATGATHIISNGGRADVTLIASATGNGLDCNAQECVAKVFGDNTEGFRDIAETAVAFAAAP